MRQLVRQARILWQASRGRYKVRIVESEAERMACAKILTDVRGLELNRSGLNFNDTPLYSGSGPFDDCAMLCTDTQTGKAIGTVRVTRASLLLREPALAPDFQFELAALGPLAEKAFLAHRLALLPAARGTGAALVIMRAIYERGIAAGELFCLLDSEPQMIKIYQRLGFRQVGRPYTQEGTLLVAMIMVCHDVEHMTKVRSPLISSWRRAGKPHDDRGIQWYRQGLEKGTVHASGFSMVKSDKEVDAQLFQGLSPKGRRELLAGATRVALEPAQLLMSKGDGQYWMAIVESGSLEASIKGRVFSVIGPHSVAGDIDFLIRKQRIADSSAGPDGAMILVLSPKASSRLSSLSDQRQLWENLARITAIRYVDRIEAELDSWSEDVARIGPDRTALPRAVSISKDFQYASN